MSEPHRIRLRGPWDVTALDAPAEFPLTAEVKMNCPCSWRDGGWPNFSGQARHTRRFGKPTNLHPHERVWLVIDACNGGLSIELNGTLIGAAASGVAFATDVSDQLRPRNELQIDVEGSDDRCGLTGEVRLEIRSAANEPARD